MTGDNSQDTDGRSTTEPPFEEYVRRQFGLIAAQMNRMEQSQAELKAEMVERFLQLSRQIKRLDQKVDIFIQEQLAIKDEWRELRDSQQPKH